MKKTVLASSIDLFRQNHIIFNNEYVFTGFILHSNPYRNPFYTLIECDQIIRTDDQVKKNYSIIHEAKYKSVMHLCLDPDYTTFLKSQETKRQLYHYFNINEDVPYNVLDIHRFPEIFNIYDFSNFHISGKKFGDARFTINHNGIDVICKTYPFNFCKNTLTATIANIKSNIDIMNSIKLENYYSLLDIFDIYVKKINITESHLSKLKQICKVKNLSQSVSFDDIIALQNLMTAINECMPPNKVNFEYKLTFKGITLIVPTWNKVTNGIVIPGVKNRIKCNEDKLYALIRFLKATKTFDSAISKLESIKLTLI